MKRTITTSFYISFVCFALVSYFTGQFQASSDGWDIMGWPINFYKYCGGCYSIITEKGVDSKEFSFLYLILDFALIYFCLFVTVYYIRKNKIKPHIIK